MKQLSGSDNLYLVAEKSNIHNHVASLSIYDASTAPGGKVRFKDILQHFESRIYAHPIFRRRLVMPPLGIDRPYWIEDGEIDVEFHIRHIALPAPGDWRQLMIQVARLHSRPLDRSKPMWEVYIIEGLDNIPKLPPGAFAMFLKLHHSAIDGVSGIQLAEKIHSLTSTREERLAGAQVISIDRPPLAIDLVARAVANGVQRVGRFARFARRAGSVVARLGIEQGMHAIGQITEPSLALPKPPDTRFDRKVSPQRVAEGFGMPLSRIKRVRSKVPGASLNDIFLAVAGGGVRRYLTAKQELPEESLVALMPMALSPAAASGGGNAVGAAMVAVRSDIAAPLSRLSAVHAEAEIAKETAERIGTDLFNSLFDVVPSAMGNFLLENVFIRNFNFTASNVRGPDRPLYLAGAKAMCLYPISIPTSGAALNITGVSYNGVMWVSMVASRNIVPDPGFLCECMRAEWEALLSAADALPQREGGAAPESVRVANKRVAVSRVASVGADRAPAPRSLRKSDRSRPGISSH